MMTSLNCVKKHLNKSLSLTYEICADFITRRGSFQIRLCEWTKNDREISALYRQPVYTKKRWNMHLKDFPTAR
jgi:hypothetical protein